MALITKSALAGLLNISTARVSQYVALGLPVRKDGRLNLDDALNWVSANIPLSDDPNKGSAKAAALVRAGNKRRSRSAPPHTVKPPMEWLEPVHAAANPFDQGFLWAAIAAARDLPALAAIAAYDAGCDVETAKKIGDQTVCNYAERMAMMMAELRIGPFVDNPDAPIWPIEPGMTINWDKVIKRAAQ
jgi:hypothetical protein